MTESLKSCCKYHIRHQRIYLKETLQMLVLREMLQATSIRPQKSENQHHHINLFLKVNYHRNTFFFPFICRFSHQNTNNLKNSQQFLLPFFFFQGLGFGGFFFFSQLVFWGFLKYFLFILIQSWNKPGTDFAQTNFILGIY